MLEHFATPLTGEPPELDWLDAALQGQPRAVLWQAAAGLVVPGSYKKHPKLAETCAAFERQGLPVRIRRSGGGAVPQGPGILNLSLAYPVAAGPGLQTDPVYLHLCGVLQQALATLGVAACTQAVQGSFCDGRFNLAVAGRKICGTAQYWRRHDGRQAVLAHALLLVDADPQLITGWANAFETALESGRRYDPQAITTVRLAAPQPIADPRTALAQAIAEALQMPLETRS